MSPPSETGLQLDLSENRSRTRRHYNRRSGLPQTPGDAGVRFAKTEPIIATQGLRSFSASDRALSVPRRTTVSGSARTEKNRPHARSSAEVAPAPVESNRQVTAGIAWLSDVDRRQSPEALDVRSAKDGSAEPQVALLACPYYKHDCHIYHPCLKYELRRIKDVKQHLYRRHRQPDFYCPRCYVVFDAAEWRDEHLRAVPSCRIRCDPKLEGISEEQRAQLHQSVSRRKSIQVQWYGIWQIVFPGQTAPESVFLGTHLEETVVLLRRFWDDRSDDIIESVVSEVASGPEAVDCPDTKVRHHAGLERIMGVLFNRLETEIGAAVEPKATTAAASTLATERVSHAEIAAARPLRSPQLFGEHAPQYGTDDMWAMTGLWSEPHPHPSSYLAIEQMDTDVLQNDIFDIEIVDDFPMVSLGLEFHATA